MCAIEDQVRGIAETIEADQYRVDVLTQISAVSKWLMGSMALNLLDEHLDQLHDPHDHRGRRRGQVKPTAASIAIARLVRS
ncbi:metal-sensing transcriptional repressor [Mycobacterium avium]|uniref:metal-sensing transcriptional repressor n=1 Tax=Mycobacterium avium TaxID=1764 RepID=UPI000A04033A|nr:metal-sensing transcriptional repressor [Mycobacterium avium]